MSSEEYHVDSMCRRPHFQIYIEASDVPRHPSVGGGVLTNRSTIVNKLLIKRVKENTVANPLSACLANV